MSFAISKDTVEDGDTVVIYVDINSIYTIDITKGKVFQIKYGALKHDDLVGKKYGSVIHCSRGWARILQPNPELWTITLPHRTQILYTPDISAIIMGLDLKPGKKVCESGTGSGSLSHALIRTIAPTGFLYTFDFHEHRVAVAREEFVEHGLSQWVTIAQRDIVQNGFGLSNTVDAVFLDLPKPWDVVPFAKNAMKPTEGGRFCSFSPCIEQVQKTCAALSEHGFSDISTMECISRPLDVRSVQLQEIPDYEEEEVENNAKHAKLCTDEKNDSPAENNNVSKNNQEKSKAGTLNNSKNNTLTSAAPSQVTGHTGYLTFASLYPVYLASQS